VQNPETICTNITSVSKPSSYTLNIVYCWGRELKFLSVPVHSRLSSLSTLPTSHVPKQTPSLGYKNKWKRGAASFIATLGTGEWPASHTDHFTVRSGTRYTLREFRVPHPVWTLASASKRTAILSSSSTLTKQPGYLINAQHQKRNLHIWLKWFLDFVTELNFRNLYNHIRHGN
jgi:hypothetical protein